MSTPSIHWSWTVDADRAGTRADKTLSEVCRTPIPIPVAALAADPDAEGDLEIDEIVPPTEPASPAPAAAPTLSRTRIQALIESGFVRVNGLVITKPVTLRERDVVEIEIPAPVPLSLEPLDIPLDILFQDEHVVVINKPAGLSVHPSDTDRGPTLVHALLHHVKDLSGIGGTLRPGIVHRLDKFTSGAMVVAKSDEAHRALVEAFANHAHERRYWAYVYGAPDLWGTHDKRIETKIARDPGDRKKMSALP